MFYVDYKVGDRIGYYEHDKPNHFWFGTVSRYVNASWRNEPSVELTTQDGLVFDMDQIQNNEVFHLETLFETNAKELPQWWEFVCNFPIEDSYESWKEFVVECLLRGISRHMAAMFFDFVTDGDSSRYDDQAIEKRDFFDKFVENAIDFEDSEDDFHSWKVRNVSEML